MSDLENLADRIRRAQLEADPVASLLAEVKTEMRATRELLESTKKNGKGPWDFALKVLCALVTAAVIGGYVWTRSIESRVARLEQVVPPTELVNTIRGTQLVVLQRLTDLERRVLRLETSQ